MVAPVLVRRTTRAAVWRTAADGEVEPDPGLDRALGDDRVDEVLAAVAGHRPVEGEDHGVDEAGLAGAGGADEGEQVGVGEVDHGGFAERREALELDALRPHAGTSASDAVTSVEQGLERRDQTGVVDAGLAR